MQGIRKKLGMPLNHKRWHFMNSNLIESKTAVKKLDMLTKT